MNERVLEATQRGLGAAAGNAHLVSVCMDGLASESKFLTGQMLTFLKGTYYIPNS